MALARRGTPIEAAVGVSWRTASTGSAGTLCPAVGGHRCVCAWARHGPPLLRRSPVAADRLLMDGFDHITDSDHSDHDGAQHQWPSDRPECSPLPRLSLMDQFDFERELERMLCPYQPRSVDDYNCY